MFAAVDLGSNSFRMHIGFYEESGFRIVKSAREPIRLAAGLDAQMKLSDEAMRRGLDCLARFRLILADYPGVVVAVVATNTLRIAANREVFLQAAEEAIGCPIAVISGEEEGRLIYMGVAHALASPTERRLVIDIGGGSTEVILGRGHEILEVESFAVGTVKHFSSYFPRGDLRRAHFDAAILAVRSLLEDARPLFAPDLWRAVYGSSGTMRAISEALAKNGFGDGELRLDQLCALRDFCVTQASIDQLNLNGVRPERMAMLVAGLAILIGLFQELKIEVLHPIDAGLRLGVLWDLVLRSTQRDRREQAVLAFCGDFKVDLERAGRLAAIARALYLQLKPSSDALSKYLAWCCLLHEVGLLVSRTAYHKHGSYLIEHADLAGFSAREQRMMSRLVLSQKGNLRKVTNILSDLDFAKAVLALRFSVSLMHTRIGLDDLDFNLKMKNKIELDIAQAWVSLHPTVACWLQKEVDVWREIGVEFVVRSNGTRTV